ncbi:NACHT domain-containing protein [Candidatus Electrothrix sp.]|uniref:NACHT domain-containing protein n=1 Tax=Candidatus Electrothrix sp. TaxID=2170559 RepID=UPI0040579572
MEWFANALQWLIDNKAWEWIFSGIGITSSSAIISITVACLLRKRNSPSPHEDISACPPNLRRDLLRRFREDLTTRLASLLDERDPLNLDKMLSPQEVSHPHSLRDILYEQEGDAPQLTGQSVIEIFNQPDTRQRLAILGKPGSGKTFSLLELFDHLLQLAEEDKNKPLPVIFECSEWDGQELVPWMAGQINKYVTKELAHQLVQDRVIFPLFDGLDELSQTRQEEFVRVFNAFQPGRSLVLCCRVKEYRHLQEKVALNHAIILQDISAKKLEGYLKRLQLYSLWDLLQQLRKEGDEGCLFELARRPLFLGIILTLEQEKKLSQDAELQSGRDAEDRLWQLYLNYYLKESLPDRVASADSYGKKYTKEQTLHWLGCLARHMNAAKKIELRIEELQPTMLHEYLRFCISYGVAVGWAGGMLFGLVFGLAGGLAYWLTAVLFFGLPGIIRHKWTSLIITGLTFGLAVGLGGGLAFGLAFGLAEGLAIGLLLLLSTMLMVDQSEGIDDISPLFFPSSVQDWKKFSYELVEGLVEGVYVGFYVQLAFGVVFGIFWLMNMPGDYASEITIYNWKGQVVIGLVFELAISLIFGLVFTLAGGLKSMKRSRIDTLPPGQAISYAAWSGVVLLPFISITVMSVFVYLFLQAEQLGVVSGKLINMTTFYSVFTVIILFYYITLGTNTVLRHCVLRLSLWQEKQLPLRLGRWLEALHHRKILQQVGGSYHFIHKQLLEYLARTRPQPSSSA